MFAFASSMSRNATRILSGSLKTAGSCIAACLAASICSAFSIRPSIAFEVAAVEIGELLSGSERVAQRNYRFRALEFCGVNLRRRSACHSSHCSNRRMSQPTPLPSSPQTVVETLSSKKRSWVTRTRAPVNSSRLSSRISRVGISRSFVGSSSRSRSAGSNISFAIKTLARSPPDKRPTG